MTNPAGVARRYLLVAAVASRLASLGSGGCASPLTVAEERDASGGSREGGEVFSPTPPKDAGLDEPVELGDPVADAKKDG